jgi:hypothetical protein
LLGGLAGRPSRRPFHVRRGLTKCVHITTVEWASRHYLARAKLSALCREESHFTCARFQMKISLHV